MPTCEQGCTWAKGQVKQPCPEFNFTIYRQYCKLACTRPNYYASYQNGRGPGRPEPRPKPERKLPRGLGDKVEAALTAIGITSERVTRWLGRPCKCSERREKLNELGRWAKRVADGKLERAKEYLERILE